jgi:hypothetical protein
MALLFMIALGALAGAMVAAAVAQVLQIMLKAG